MVTFPRLDSSAGSYLPLRRLSSGNLTFSNTAFRLKSPTGTAFFICLTDEFTQVSELVHNPKMDLALNEGVSFAQREARFQYAETRLNLSANAVSVNRKRTGRQVG